ncbi:MAG: biotin--[acetyl-CoA-carboxylase] ligase [Candidatus Omnitrophica bacterium]|nr:biotin--[acetyl-CoA-carboxylase] ligase [Candidatus Omnitrophota bacterium]
MKKEDRVLEFLRAAGKAYVSGEKISERLNVSRAYVWKEIMALRRLGYRIEAHPHEGYRLVGIPDRLFPDEIARDLGTRRVGRQILSYKEIGSTNDAAFRLGEQGVGEGVSVFAEHQKKGRGRMGRSWVCPKGKGVLVSILLRPILPPVEVSKMTLMAAVSVVRAVRQATGLKLGIKWPNDILAGGRKVCGILTEMSAELDRVNFVVVGIGINVNASARELPPGATSLKTLLGKKISRVEFARALLREIDRDYERLIRGQFGKLAGEWEEHSVTSGKHVIVRTIGRKLEGVAAGIDADGALWIRRDDGLQEKVLAGDVEHLR